MMPTNTQSVCNAEQCDRDDAYKYAVCFEVFAGLIDQIAKARRSGNEFRPHQCTPAVAEAESEAGENAGHGRRQHDQAKNFRARKVKRCADLQKLAVNISEGRQRIEVDGKKAGENNDGNLWRLIDSQPQNEQRNHGQRRRHAKRFKHNVHALLGLRLA